MPLGVAVNEVNNFDSSNSNMPNDGDYHCLVEAVRENSEDEEKPLEVDFMVIAGTPAKAGEPLQQGFKFTEKFFKTDKADGKGGNAKRLTILAIALGLTTRQIAEDCKANNKPLVIDYTKGVGRSVCLRSKTELYAGKKEEHKGKSFANIGFNLFSPKDPAVDGWKKDQAHLARVPNWIPYVKGGAPTKPAPAAPTAPVGAAAEAPADPWG